MSKSTTYEVEKTAQGWILTIGTIVAPMFFDTRKAAVAYAKRKLSGHDPEWPVVS
jgi:hypothetical protein